MPLPVRSVPPWVRDCEEDDLVPTPLEEVHSPQRSRWYSFAAGGAYPHERRTAAILTPDQLEKMMPDQMSPWRARRPSQSTTDTYQPLQRRSKTFYQRMSYMILRNPFIPLVFRLITLIFAASALALGSSIHHISDHQKDVSNNASSMIAIVVDAIAIPYICGVTWDEYTGKPLGLRSAGAKLRIVLLDLFFIVFQSANLALAFQSLSQATQGCGPRDQGKFLGSLCDRAEALSAVLLIALLAWLLTFSVSVLRLVERVAQE